MENLRWLIRLVFGLRLNESDLSAAAKAFPEVPAEALEDWLRSRWRWSLRDPSWTIPTRVRRAVRNLYAWEDHHDRLFDEAECCHQCPIRPTTAERGPGRTGEPEQPRAQSTQRRESSETTPIPTAPEESPPTSLMVNELNEADVRKDLRRWLTDCTNLVICDPYFLQPDQRIIAEDDYFEDVEAALSRLPAKARLTIYHLPGPSRKASKRMRDIANARNLNYATKETTLVHDRVWIRKDTKEARLIGTSFAGLGNKVCFMLDLPDVDLQAFMTELAKVP